jgi:hypothetical protein
MALPIYAPSNQPMNEMFLQALIEKNAVEDYVVTMFPQLNVFNFIANKYNAPKVKMGRMQYQMERIGNTYVAGTISTQTLTNGQMILTFENAYDAFRIDDGVKAISGAEGVVVRKETGKVWLDFHASPTGATAFDSGTDFLVNETASSRGDFANINNPDMRKSRLVTEPSYFYNYINRMREVAEITGTEAWEETFLANVGGKSYQLDAQIQMAMLRASMDFAVRTYDGIASTRGGRYTGDGFEQQIKNGGGVIKGLTGQLTQSALHDMINSIAKNGGLNGNRLVGVTGIDYLGGFQTNVAAPLIQYPGKENTVGGNAVMGINSFEYAFEGITLEYFIDPLFNNSNAFGLSTTTGLSKYNNSCFYFSPDPVITNSSNRPWMEQKYNGPTDMIVTETNSILDQTGNVRQGLTDGMLEYARIIVYQKTMQLINPAAHAIHIGS